MPHLTMRYVIMTVSHWSIWGVKMDGGCLCGAVRYKAGKLSSPVTHCHCKECQKWHGAAFATWANVEMEHFTWSRGEEKLALYEHTAGWLRGFCRECGASLCIQPTRKHNGKIICITLGSLDDPPDKSPENHIFVSEQASWFEFADSLPKCERWWSDDHEFDPT